MKYFMMGLVALTVAGCGASDKGKPSFFGGDIQKLDYTYKNENFHILYKYDGLLRGYGTEIVRLGKPLSTDSGDDILVQTVLRAAFTAKICKKGLHGGILGMGYGPMDARGKWGAKIRCSTKIQKAPPA